MTTCGKYFLYNINNKMQQSTIVNNQQTNEVNTKYGIGV